MLIVSEKSKLQKINFHDAFIAKIICDYDNGTVEMPIIMDDKGRYNAFLKFENVVYVEINRREPWGPGINVISLDIEEVEGDLLKVNIVLSSGDEINITAPIMIYSTDD
ncbi:MAG TPA: hypothetical protein DCP36_14935 [Sporomusaceae bacterium]|nr:hypothetical protein [Sporomusaceae bacterium]